jgi:hypothetical protein
MSPGVLCWLGFHIADEIVRRASLLAHGEFLIGKCGPMGRYSLEYCSLVVPHDEAGVVVFLD